jgi:hypothetical protein
MRGIGRVLKALVVAGLLGVAGAWAAEDVEVGRVLIVRGADGEAAYGEVFARQAGLWRQAAAASGREVGEVGPEDAEAALVKVGALLSDWVKAQPPELWVVLIGHGTFDGREAKLNLTGEDLTPGRLAELLKPYSGRLVMVHTGSSSQPFAAALKGPGRVLVSATKSADEVFYTRFGVPFAEAIGGLEAADLDQDGQVSVLEAFLHAADAVSQFYVEEERIATEHALLDDNGDGVGTRAEVFEAGRPKPEAGDLVDGELARRVVLKFSAEEQRLTAEERRSRDALEVEIEALRKQREGLGDEAYYAEMEKLMLKLSRLLLRRP